MIKAYPWLQKKLYYTATRGLFGSLFSKGKTVNMVASPEEDPKQKFNIKATEGKNLMDSLNESDISDLNVFGICDKQLACHSWRVHITEGYDKLVKPDDDELDVLYDLGGKYIDKCTRMSCQLKVTEEMEGVHIVIPRSAFSIFDDGNDSD